MIEKGTIVKIKGDKATVQFDRKSACDKCHMCAVTKDSMKVQVVVKNTLNLNVGDYVAVEMGRRFVLTAAFIVYIIPLVLVGIGIGIGYAISEMWQVILALIGLVVGFVISAVLDRVLRKKKGFVPVMVDIPIENEQFRLESLQPSDGQASDPTIGQTPSESVSTFSDTTHENSNDLPSDEDKPKD